MLACIRTSGCHRVVAMFRRPAAARPEPPQQLGEAFGFMCQALGGRRGLFDHCGVLLRHLVHLVVEAAETSRRLVACSRAETAISATVAFMAVTCSTICSSERPDSPTSWTPVLTCAEEVEISCLISLAALAERWASSRTSWATTAKPLPASLYARRFHAWRSAPAGWSGRRSRR